MLAGERRQRDFIDPAARVPDGLELDHQRMRGIDLVVAVGADQQQVPQIRVGQQVFEQVERRGIEPLQVVEKERKRMLRPGKYTDETPEHEQETALRLLWLKCRDRWRLPNDQLQFGDEVGHEPRIGLQRLQKRVAPVRQLRIRLAEQRAHQAPEGLRESGIRDGTFVLVELTRSKKAAGRYEHLVQLIDDRGLTDTGIS